MRCNSTFQLLNPQVKTHEWVLIGTKPENSNVSSLYDKPDSYIHGDFTFLRLVILLLLIAYMTVLNLILHHLFYLIEAENVDTHVKFLEGIVVYDFQYIILMRHFIFTKISLSS